MSVGWLLTGLFVLVNAGIFGLSLKTEIKPGEVLIIYIYLYSVLLGKLVWVAASFVRKPLQTMEWLLCGTLSFILKVIELWLTPLFFWGIHMCVAAFVIAFRVSAKLRFFPAHCGWRLALYRLRLPVF